MAQQKSLISIDDLSNEEIFLLFKTADEIQKNKSAFSKKCAEKILALLFFEPSTRTYFSFASAMHRLGGNVIGFAGADSTSAVKGESLEDTVRVMSAYSDIMAIRHPETGSLEKIKSHVNIPLINAGEGAGEHPTQTLSDLYTIQKQLKRLDITIALYGDLKFGRTNHSLLLAGARLGANFICVAPDSLQIPDIYKQEAEKFGSKILLTNEIEPYLKTIDVLYVSRLQRERLPANFQINDLKKHKIVDLALLAAMRNDSIVMHPLPRVDEIHSSVDKDPRAKYFEQAANAIPIRMAILLHCLGYACD